MKALIASWVAISWCLSASGPALAQAPPLVLFDNGPLVTHPGGGSGGADASRLQNTTLSMGTFGFTASTTLPYWIADRFTVPPPGWSVDTITFFAYELNSTTTSTFNDVRVQIRNGAPNAGGAVVFGDLVTNRYSSSAFTNIYRDSETSVGSSQRPIMAVRATIGTTLSAGTYWVEFRLGGTLGTGPFVPPVTKLQSSSPCSPCDALQWSSSAWAAMVDTGSGTQQDARFLVEGTVVCPTLVSTAIDPPGAQMISCPDGSGSMLTVTDSGGGIVTHQWGYRTAPSGPMESIPSETGTTYTPQGSHFPSPGAYLIVCKTTPSPTCGSPMVSNEVPLALFPDAAAPVVGAPKMTIVLQTMCQ